MRLKIKANLGTNQFPETPWKNGEVREVKDKALSDLLLVKGLAEETKEALTKDEPQE